MPTAEGALTEAEKWDRPKSRGGYGPDGYEPYPKTLFRAKDEGGRIVVEDRVVANEHEHRLQERDGWVAGGPEAAKARLNALQEDVARAAAEAAAGARKMSGKAQAEYTQAERTSDEHVTDVTPRKR